MGFLLVATLFFILPHQNSTTAIDIISARKYFLQAKHILEKDNGRLWGKPLYGPMLFVDPATRQVVANQGDSEGQLTKSGEIFVGNWPKNLPVANTTVTWLGMKWSVILWPLPQDKFERARLMVHESWHCVQNELGFPSTFPGNNHLDPAVGRIWLQLEWRALAKALGHHGAKRLQAITDALVFRARRRQLFEKAAAQECALEMHEGLAEYTGFKLCGLADEQLPKTMARQLDKTPQKMETFVGSFAYVSGPAYGILLDETGVDWRKNLKSPNDLGFLLQQAFKITLPMNLQEVAEQRLKRYDGEKLHAQEFKRENKRRQLLADYRARLVDGPVVILPLGQIQISFDPGALRPLDNLGTVSRTLKLSDVWGTLEVTNGALLAADWSQVQVPAPAALNPRPLTGDGWTLTLNAGWEIFPAARSGDYILRKTP